MLNDTQIKALLEVRDGKARGDIRHTKFFKYERDTLVFDGLVRFADGWVLTPQGRAVLVSAGQGDFWRSRRVRVTLPRTIAHTRVGRFRVHTGLTPDMGLETMVFDMKPGSPWGGTVVDSGTRHYRTTREALRGHSEIVRSMHHVAQHYASSRRSR